MSSPQTAIQTPLKPKAGLNGPPTQAKPKSGLRSWMERVLVECDRAAAGFDADPVHDLRVALRRCRSLADGMMAIDPDPAWKQMKKAGKKLFQSLGELRDMQVMEEWIEKLSGETGKSHPSKSAKGGAASVSEMPGTGGAKGEIPHDFDVTDAGDPVAAKLLEHIHLREAECKQRAFKELSQFDRKQWRQWSRMLPQRAARVRPGSVVYLHLALEKWTAAYELHKRALRSRSQVAWHDLRIGIKRYRYTVENLLPRQHEAWGDDLKDLQDVLGDVHDLDVLWAKAVEIQAFPDAESRVRWREKVQTERAKRIERYRAKMVGKPSLWPVWRAELPSGPQLATAAMTRLRTWAAYLDPDFAHSQRVAQLALALYDGLKSLGLLHSQPTDSSADSQLEPRAVLQAAALMHDVGKAKGQTNHQKRSYRMIRELVRPLGWSVREQQLAAVVARYHRGALPHPRGNTMQSLELPDRPVAAELAGILRLGNALDSRDMGSAIRIEVELQDRVVKIKAEGYSALDRSAEEVAAARHLLETVLRRPIAVRALRVGRGGVRTVRRVVAA